LPDLLPDTDSNNTNEVDIFYFVRMRNHYLQLVRSSSSITSRHDMQYPIISDSGANFHRFCEREFFETLTPTTGRVILGDGNTTLDILGIGTVRCVIGSNILCIENVRFFPGLAESIYSLFIHIKQPNHGLHSSFGTGFQNIFPTFQTTVLIGNDDVYVDVLPHADNDVKIDFSCLPVSSLSNSVCPHVTHLSGHAAGQTKTDGNLLKSLRDYYSDTLLRTRVSVVPSISHQPYRYQLIVDLKFLCKYHQLSSLLPIPNNI
jgi:hypothetical protein